MKNQRNTILILIGIIAALCIVIGLAGILMLNVFSNRTANQPATEPAATVEILETESDVTVTRTPDPAPTGPTATSVPGDPEPTESSSGDHSLPDDVIQEMEKIQADVIELRGLNPAGSFTREILTREELTERVTTEFFADYTPEEAADDARVLAVLGLLEPDFDLVALFTELYSEQVLGYYDDETGEMVVVGSDNFEGPEKLTYAHEYAHALQDENFDFDQGLQYNDEACEIDTERCAAIQALIEGEASLIELQWFFDYASIRDQQDIIAYYDTLDLSDFETYPAYLQKDFGFPYDQGYTFVESLFVDGGWEAINDAYANPPVSTEQILHPEKYPEDTPVPVPLPDLVSLLGENWEVVDDNVMGEWFTYLILAHGWQPQFRIHDGDAAEAAAGWGGDRYLVLINRDTDEIVLVMKSVWDSNVDKFEFATAFRAYGNARFGPAGAFGSDGQLWETNEGVHIFLDTPGSSIWIAAPNPGLAQEILEAVR